MNDLSTINLLDDEFTDNELTDNQLTGINLFFKSINF